MQALSPNLHPGIVEMWDNVIPKLSQYLEGIYFNSKFFFEVSIKMGKFYDDFWYEMLPENILHGLQCKAMWEMYSFFRSLCFTTFE